MSAVNYDTEWSRFKNGDINAFEIIYRDNIQSLFSYGLKITSNTDLIRDCIQDLFIELWKGRKNLADVSEPKFYLFRALRNKLATALASPSLVNKEAMPFLFDQLTSENVEIQIIAKEQEMQDCSCLQQLLQKLPKRQQEAIYLRFYHNLPYDHIASQMGMNYQSVLNLVQRALKTLRREYSLHLLAGRY